MQQEVATFGAGCFWGVEETFCSVPGVTKTEVGYMGGTLENPTYEDVCSGATGHAEVVQVTFDPENVSYEELLRVFWNCHDPTQLNHQGPDRGSNYRSVIFTHSEQQRTLAEASKEAEQKTGQFSDPIVTEISPAPAFWRAEEYHQQYIQKNGGGCKR